MRWALCLLLLPLAGCVEPEEPSDPVAPVDNPLDVYVFWFPDEAGMPSQGSGTTLDYMVRVHNGGTDAVRYAFDASAVVAGRVGSVNDIDGWHPNPVVAGGPTSFNDTLAPGEARLWIVQGERFCCHGIWVALQIDGQEVFRQDLATHDGAGTLVAPGSHVQTVTVGVWTNGTSFYTNSPEMLADPDFPAGGNINRTEAQAAAAPLPVYVYDVDRTEQPPGSRDNCYFTTIEGYNLLLKTQTTQAAGVLAFGPEMGYTRPGNEDHFLYGEPLIFMNAIVAVDAPAIGFAAEAGNAVESLPDPSGACFDAQNTVAYASERVPL